MRTFKSLMLSGDACRENCLFMLKTPILNTWELQCMRAEMSGYMHGDDGTIKQKTSACFFQILTLQMGY